MLISIDALTKSYGSVRALDDVRVTFEPGQIVPVLGPNGLRRETLASLIAGLAESFVFVM